MKKLKIQEADLPEFIDATKKYYVLEITNKERSYVMSASNHKDLESWFKSIASKIESHRTNNFINENLNKMNKIEQEIAERDEQ